MKLWSIPGLMSICVLLTHSSRFVLSAGRNEIFGQAWKSGTKKSKAPEGSQSSKSQAKPTQTSGTNLTHAQSQPNPPAPASTPSGTSASSSQTHRSSTPSQPRTTGSPAINQSSSTPPKLADSTPALSVSSQPKESKSGTSGSPSSQSPTTNQSQTTHSPIHTSTPTNSSTSGPVSPVSNSQVNSNRIIPRKVVLPEQNLSGTNSSLSKFKIVTEDSTEPNDTSKYYLKASTDLITFKFKYDSRCTELKFEDKSVWKYDQTKHKNNHPNYILVNNNSKIIYLKIGDSVFACSLEGQNWSGSEAKPVQLDISKKESTAEFEFSNKDNTGTYKAKDNVVFNEVIKKKGSDLTLYQTKDQSQCVYKVTLDPLDSKDEKVILHLANGRVLTLTKDNDYSYNPKPWTPFGPSELTIITEGSKGHDDISQYDIFSDHGIFDYVFGEKTKCTQVIFKDDLIWELKDNKPFPKYLIYYRNESRLFLSFDLENIIFIKQEDKWYKTTSMLDVIDINTRETTDRFKYTKKENSSIGSLEAKYGHGFNKVYEKKSGWNCCGSDKLVWEAEDGSEHAVKIIFDGLDTGQSTKEVQIYLANDDILKYTKTGGCCNKQWTLLSTHLHASHKSDLTVFL